MTILKIILIPFSILYALIIFLRNKFYDTGIFKSYKVSKPVISIGNITSGGTGKTPLTIFIADYFLQKGKRVGIVSRGYKRKSAETAIVCNGKTVLSVEKSGDELKLISDSLVDKYPDKIFTAAGIDRVSASELLIKEFNPDLIILDDAFQHRKIKRDLDLVLIEATEMLNKSFLKNILLPAGKLRESYRDLKRAGIIIQNNKNYNENIIPELKKYGKEIVVIRYKTEYFMDYKNSILDKNEQSVILFSGIANSESFSSMVKSADMNISKKFNFADHHEYSIKDIEELKSNFNSDKIFITTEKDFVKIKQFRDFTEKYPVYYLKLKIEITSGAKLLSDELDKVLK